MWKCYRREEERARLERPLAVSEAEGLINAETVHVEFSKNHISDY
jgi:hypothetical protein